MSSLERNILSKGKNLPVFPSNLSKENPATKSKGRIRDYSPLPWTEFFDEKLKLPIDGDLFNVYRKGTVGPVFLLIHGGGYSALTWACLAEELSSRIDCRIVAPDLRGHGDTETQNVCDLSTDRLVKDLAAIHNALFSDEQSPPTFLIGHSMGGAMAVHLASRYQIANLIALTVIDVVEGSAMNALHGMTSFLRGRPTQFDSIQTSIEWHDYMFTNILFFSRCLRTGTTRNIRAARVSMPGQIRQKRGLDANGKGHFEWRVNLIDSKPHWAGWFANLSRLFLPVDAPKLLVLAGVDRLDKELTIGQMQGRFQMLVLPKVGHAVHEDCPDRLADVLVTFCVRNKFCVAKGPYQPVYPGC